MGDHITSSDISIKTELEFAKENDNPHEKSKQSELLESTIMGEETRTSVVDVELEPRIKLEDDEPEKKFEDKCQLEMKQVIETYDEFCSTDARSIYFEEPNNKSIIKTEQISDVTFEPATKNYTANNVQTEDASSSDKLRRYKCDQCEYAAKYKFILKRHQIKHSDLKPFKCGKCSYRTKTKKHLNRHQLVHKDILEVDNFRCKKCDYVTKYLECLTRHQLVHLDPSSVKINKAFKCDMCNYIGKRKTNLERHQLTHKDITEVELVFKCALCNYLTKCKSYLRRHVVAMHNKKNWTSAS